MYIICSLEEALGGVHYSSGFPGNRVVSAAQKVNELRRNLFLSVLVTVTKLP